jgi:hypothetical protein
MKTQFKNLINNFAQIFLMLMAMFVLGFGCNASKPTPDPLAGWKTDFHEQPSQAIEKDYHDFIQKLQSEGNGPAAANGFLEDGTGQHAIVLEIFEYNKNASWQYALIYDKEDKIIKVIKYGYRKYQS